MFVPVPSWWHRYDLTRLLYVPTPPVFSYCTGAYMKYRDDKARVEMLSRTENALMTAACIFAACRNGDSSHSFAYLQFDRHSGGILVSLPIGVLEDVKVLGLYSVIRLIGYDSVLCLLALRRSQEIDWSRYGGTDPAFLGYDLKTGPVFNVPPLRANKRTKTGSTTVFDVLRREAR